MTLDLGHRLADKKAKTALLNNMRALTIVAWLSGLELACADEVTAGR
jgi:hypothetical protein